MSDILVSPQQFEQTLTATGASTLISKSIPTARDGRLSFQVTPTGCNITNLKIQGRLHNQSPNYIDLLVDGDFASSSIAEVIRTSAVPPESAVAGSTSWSILALNLMHDIRFVMVVSGAGSVLLQGVH